jgi:hypothetical protein
VQRVVVVLEEEKTPYVRLQTRAPTDLWQNRILTGLAADAQVRSVGFLEL